MKWPIVKVPDFREEVEKEFHNTQLFSSMSDQEREAHIQDLIVQRALVWSCRTSAASYNLCSIVLAILILTNGKQLLDIVTAVILSYIK